MAPLDDQKKPQSGRPHIEMERSGEGEKLGPMKTHEDLVAAIERLQVEGTANFDTFAQHMRAELDDVEKSGTKGFRDFFTHYGKFRRRLLGGLMVIVAGMLWALFAGWQNDNKIERTARYAAALAIGQRNQTDSLQQVVSQNRQLIVQIKRVAEKNQKTLRALCELQNSTIRTLVLGAIKLVSEPPNPPSDLEFITLFRSEQKILEDPKTCNPEKRG